MPPEIRARAFTVAPWLVNVAEAVKPSPGSDPAVFRERLAAVLGTPLLTASNRVDLFVHLEREIALSFEGGLPIPPKPNFAQFRGVLTTFDRKVGAEPRIALDVDPLLKIAADEATSSTLRSANALLLSAYVDGGKTRPVLLKLLAPDRLKSAQCPPVALFIYSRAADLCWNSEVEKAFVELLRDLPGEEDREVALCALGIHATPAGLEAIRGTLLREDLPVDLGLKTGIWILKKRSPPASFAEFLAKAKAATTDASRLKRLEEYATDAPPAKEPPGMFIKLWDGFDTSIYEGGEMIMIYKPTGFVGLLESKRQ